MSVKEDVKLIVKNSNSRINDELELDMQQVNANIEEEEGLATTNSNEVIDVLVTSENVKVKDVSMKNGNGKEREGFNCRWCTQFFSGRL